MTMLTRRCNGADNSQGPKLTSSGRTVSSASTRSRPEGGTMDMKLELVAVPVSDPDRAKAFYTEQVGFNADHDIPVQEGLRFIQLTPPGSACGTRLGRASAPSAP